MQKATTMFAGLDAHKDQVALAYAASNPGSEESLNGQIGRRQCNIDKLIRTDRRDASELAHEMRPFTLAIEQQIPIAA